MDLDLDAIRARAIAAGGATVLGFHKRGDGWALYAATAEQVSHIAGMDPATTLALLDEIEDLKSQIIGLENGGDRYC